MSNSVRRTIEIVDEKICLLCGKEITNENIYYCSECSEAIKDIFDGKAVERKGDNSCI